MKCQNLISCLLLFISMEGVAQLTVVQGSSLNMTPQQLVQNWLVGQGITINNVTFNGSSALITSDQIGTFTATGNAFTELNLDAGIVMTSGTAENAVGPNNTCGIAAFAFSGGDADLDIIAGVSTADKAVIEFDFIPSSDTIRFRYVFGSDEIWTFCGSFNDAFGFFLSGPGIDGIFSNNAENIALMPGTSNWVTLNNMCDDASSTWCNAPVICQKNTPPPPASFENCTDPLGSGQYLQYNGLTYVFTAWHVVFPCSTYHIKLAVGDAMDMSNDSGVFLEKNSFSTGGLSIHTTYTIPSLGNHAIEGCSNAVVSLTLSNPVINPYTINLTVGGTATNGIDYFTIPNFITFPAGSDSVVLIVQPFFDGIPEGIETVILGFSQITCSVSQTTYDTISIHDNTVLSVYAGQDDSICAGDSAILTASGSGGQQPYTYQWNIPGGNDSVVRVSPGIGMHTYIQTLSDACGTLTLDSMILIVHTGPTMTNDPMSKTICSEENTNLILQASIPGSEFSWIAHNVSGNITGYSNGSGDIIDQILTNSATFTDSVLYIISPVNSGCPGNDTTFVINVRPKPDVIITPAQDSICGGEYTNITLESGVTGTNFFWIASGTSGIFGYSAGSGNLIHQKLFNTGLTTGTAMYSVTPSISGCIGIPDDVSLSVLPAPLVSLSRCVDTITSIQAAPVLLKRGIPIGGQYSGQGVNTTTGIFEAAKAGIGLHKIHYTYTNMLGCQSEDSMTITVQAVVPFSCGEIFTDIRDNNQYPTVMIGNQCWLAVNLNHGQQIGGSSAQQDNCLVEKYCYNDLPANCAQYGALYQWDELMRYEDSGEIQGLCPPGWHVPSEADWTQLFAEYQGNAFAGSPLLYTGYSGYNVLLAGVEFFNQSHRFADFASIMWSSTSHGSYKAWSHGLNEYNYSVSYYPSYRSNAFSVRCLLD